MASVMVRVDEDTHKKLKEIAAREGVPLQGIISAAIEEYRSRHFWEEVNAAYSRLRSDPRAWREELAERATLEGTLGDDLEQHEIWHEDGTVTFRDKAEDENA